MCNMNNENIETVFEVGIPARGLSRSLRGLGASNEQAQHILSLSAVQYINSCYQLGLTLVVTGQRLRTDDHAADKGYRRYPG